MSGTLIFFSYSYFKQHGALAPIISFVRHFQLLVKKLQLPAPSVGGRPHRKPIFRHVEMLQGGFTTCCLPDLQQVEVVQYKKKRAWSARSYKLAADRKATEIDTSRPNTSENVSLIKHALNFTLLIIINRSQIVTRA